MSSRNPYGYTPSKPAAIAFIILYALTAVVHLGETLFLRRRVWWTLVFTAGGIMEVIGWVGRFQSSEDTSLPSPYIMQIATLVIAPAWLSAGCYAVTGAMIRRFGKRGSPLNAKAYTVIFVICDIISIGLQAGGGATAGKESDAGKIPSIGRWLLLAGVVFQLGTMLIYITLSLRFFRQRWLEFTSLRKRLIEGTVFCSFCIIVRGIIRTAELSEGWKGFVFTHESFTIFLDGLPILMSMVMFNLVHPGYTLDGDDPKVVLDDHGRSHHDGVPNREKSRQQV